MPPPKGWPRLRPRRLHRPWLDLELEKSRLELEKSRLELEKSRLSWAGPKLVTNKSVIRIYLNDFNSEFKINEHPKNI